MDGSAFCTQCGAAQGAEAPAPAYAAPAYLADAQQANLNNNNSKLALGSLIVGLVCIVAWLIPIIGVALSITAIGLGTKGLKSEKKGMAIAGLILGGLFLVASVINWIVGAMQAIGVV